MHSLGGLSRGRASALSPASVLMAQPGPRPGGLGLAPGLQVCGDADGGHVVPASCWWEEVWCTVLNQEAPAPTLAGRA